MCTGNICRSPMAEFIARGRAERELDVPARFSSAGTSDEEDGNPVDPRAARQLRAAGYATGGHVAHRITGAEIAAADLIVGMEEHHVRALRRSAPGADVRLLSEFDPGARPGQGVPDPWYGGQEGFERTAAAIEAAIPGIFAHIRRFATGAADAV
nr:low molecular weight protein-tyrosine-phosphatase [Propionicicella superfundia]